MRDLVFETSDSPPLPSYQISQNEFDRKTNRALMQSAAEPPRPRVDEDGFEIWDDSVFEAYATQDGMRSPAIKGSISSGSVQSSSVRLVPSSCTSRSEVPDQAVAASAKWRDGGTFQESEADAAGLISSQTRALNATNRRRSEKRRPSPQDITEDGKDTANSHPLRPQPSSTSSTVPEARRLHRAPRRQLTVFNDVGDAAEGQREVTPPPEFTPVGPSLDGPPYEVVIMSYDGPELEPADPVPEPPGFDEHSSENEIYSPAAADNMHPSPVHPQSTSPKSPLHSPTTHSAHTQTLLPNTATQVQPSKAEHHLRSAHSHPKLPRGPRIPFDPQTAYSRPLPTVSQRGDLSPQAVDASVFYSHAVAAQFTANIPARLRQPVRPDRSSIHSDHWSMPMPMVNGINRPNQVASPKPSYAYGRAAFSETSSLSSEAVSTNNQHPWSPGGHGGRR